MTADRPAVEATAPLGWRWWEILVLCAVATVPFAEALVTWRAGWLPVGDNANLAIRAQDVGTTATPLLGMPSGLGAFTSGVASTTHPGPLVFWVLGPWVRLFGNGPVPVLLGAAVVAAAASVGFVWCGRLLAGRWGVVTSASMVVIIYAYAQATVNLSAPLNPVMALLPALAALAAAAAFDSGERRALFVLVPAASLAAQADSIYVITMAGVAVFILLREVPRRIHGRVGPIRRRHTLITFASCGVLWAGPIIDVLAHAGGNVRATYDAAAVAKMEPLGWAASVGTLGAVVHPVGWLRWSPPAPAPGGPGIWVAIGAGAVIIGAAVRRAAKQSHGRSLVWISGIAILTLVASQWFTPAAAGRDSFYLLPVVLVGAFVWFAVASVARVPDVVRSPRARAVVCLVVLLVGAGPLSSEFTRRQFVQPGTAAVVPMAKQVAARLGRGRYELVSAGGPNGQSLLRGVGFRLEEKGFDTRYSDDQVGYVGSRRTVGSAPGPVDALVLTRELAVRPPGWTRVAAYRPGLVSEERLASLRSRVATSLRRSGIRLTHQASQSQTGQIIVFFGGGDPALLLDEKPLGDLGRDVLIDRDRLAGLPDDVLATLAEEQIIHSNELDPALQAAFLRATADDDLDIWLVPAAAVPRP